MLVLRIRAINFWQFAVDRLLDKSAENYSSRRASLKAFVSYSLLTGLLALAALPLYVGLSAAPHAFAILVLLAVSLNILLASAVVRTDAATALYAVHGVCYAWLITSVALATGGVGSFAILMLLMLPLGGMILKSASIVRMQLGCVCAALFVLVLASAALPVVMAPSNLFDIGDFALFALLSMAQIGLFFFCQQPEESNSTTEHLTFDDLAKTLGESVLIVDKAQNIEQVFGSNHQIFLDGEALPVSLRQFYRCIHIQDLPAVMQTLSDALQNNFENQISLRLKNTSGSFDAMTLQIAPVSSTGKVALVLRSSEKQVELQNKLEAALEAAARAQTSKSQFLSSVSHELRTPLNAILGFSDIMAEGHMGQISPDQVQEYSRIIHKSGQTLLHFINQVIDLSKIESGSFQMIAEPFHINKLLQAALDEQSSLAKSKNVALVFKALENDYELTQDSRAVSRVLAQVLANAVHYAPEGSEICLSAGRKGQGVEVCIADKGKGVPKELCERVFEAFVKANHGYDSDDTGAGLGLTIANGLIKQQKGTIKLEPNLGGGTLARIYWPQSTSSLCTLEVEKTAAKPSVATKAEAAEMQTSLKVVNQ